MPESTNAAAPAPAHPTSPLAGVLEKTLDNLQEGFAIFNREYKFLYANDLWALQTHKRKEDLIGRAAAEIFPGIFEQPLFKALKKCMESRQPAREENLFTYADGEQRWFRIHFMPIDEGVVALSLDIDEAKRNALELEAKIKELNDISSAMTKREVRMSELKRTIADLIGIAEKQHRLN